MDSYQSIESLLACYLHNPRNRERIVIPQFKHRLDLCNAWNLPAGVRLLDIGCGQGESTLVLADKVGPDGHITGVDPASPDYGGPITVGQAQSFILASPYASRLTFERAQVAEVLQRLREKNVANSMSKVDAQVAGEAIKETISLPPSPGPEPIFDGAVFLHSLWYARSRDIVSSLFKMVAAARIPRIYFAEWKCQANNFAQEPHYLAVRAQMKLHSYKPLEDGSPRLDEQNVRGALPPEELLEIATSEGWKVARRGELAMPTGYMEGYWEAQFVSSSAFIKAVEKETMAEEQAEELRSYADVITHSMEVLKKNKKRVESMNVAWAVLELNV